jgi:hypothetical protein
MVNGAFYFRARSFDFGLKRGNPRLQFRYRKRIEILTGKARHGIVFATRQILVCVHAASVDRTGREVNKATGNYGTGNFPEPGGPTSR